MRYALYLTFDSHTEQALQRLRENMSGAPRMRPHLTLLVFDAENQATILETFKEVASGLKAFPLLLQKISMFRGRSNVLYVEPAFSLPLKESYLRCRGAFNDSAIAPSYQHPTQWKPHITLAKGLDSQMLSEARAAAEKRWVPMTAHIQSMGLINVQKPQEALASHALYP